MRKFLPHIRSRATTLSTQVVRHHSRFFNQTSNNTKTLFGFAFAAVAGSLFYFNYNTQSIHAQTEAEEIEKEQTQLPNFSDNVPIFRIVITGGPCAGKSSAMTKLSERLKALGFEVFIVTEVATLLTTSGVRLNSPDATWEQMLQNESVLLKTKMALEDGFTEIAKASKKPTIILCDRGVMDSKAFLDDNS